MADKQTEVPKITPVELIKKNNPLIKNIEKISAKWSKRWPHIAQPWPVEGTLNPGVINTIQVLASTHKKKGRAGRIQQEKRTFELGVLELFKVEGQKLLQAKRRNKVTTLKIWDRMQRK